jgi:hypothetical protein
VNQKGVGEEELIEQVKSTQLLGEKKTKSRFHNRRVDG